MKFVWQWVNKVINLILVWLTKENSDCVQLYFSDSVDFYILQFKLQWRSDYYLLCYEVVLAVMTVWG